MELTELGIEPRTYRFVVYRFAIKPHGRCESTRLNVVYDPAFDPRQNPTTVS